MAAINGSRKYAVVGTVDFIFAEKVKSVTLDCSVTPYVWCFSNYEEKLLSSQKFCSF
jgi:hypothetical protein